MSFSARNILFSILISFFLLLITVRPSFAQTNPDVPKNLHTFTQSATIEVMAAMICQLTGIDPIDTNQKCLGIDRNTGKIGFVENGGGAIGMMSGMITMLYTPPLHSTDYFAYLGGRFGITKPAYAQVEGVGFKGLTPLLSIWTVFRNVVYLLFVIVFVVIGAAIMLRVKIDPRTVMTIENQIPKIIIGLVLVTFSFAIAGFLIDIMYISIYLIGNLLLAADPKNAGNIGPITAATDPFQAASIIGKNFDKSTLGIEHPGIAQLAEQPAEQIGSFVKSMFEGTFGRITMTAVGGLVGGLIPGFIPGAGKAAAGIGGKISTIAGAAATKAPLIGAVFFGLTAAAASFFFEDQALGFFAGLITFLIITIAMIFALFKLWFGLLQAYVYILIDVVFAPFWILGGLIPGSPIGFTGWIRSMLGNLAAFPIAIGMFLMADVFMRAFGTGVTEGQFVPPLTGPSATNGTGVFIGIGIILLTPQAVDIAKQLFKGPQNKYGSAVFQTLGVGAGAVNLPQQAMKFASARYYWQLGFRGVPVLGNLLGKPHDTTVSRPEHAKV